jgi:23S rRNA U2552 (ribose-2'-O)-methylase RlmE/FtsJ
VVGVDLKPVEVTVPSNVRVLTGDVEENGVDLLKSLELQYNIVLSDMAPATTGRKDIDSYRSLYVVSGCFGNCEIFFVTWWLFCFQDFSRT